MRSPRRETACPAAPSPSPATGRGADAPEAVTRQSEEFSRVPAENRMSRLSADHARDGMWVGIFEPSEISLEVPFGSSAAVRGWIVKPVGCRQYASAWPSGAKVADA